jgi:UDP-3-O-[3-hydroxymyristoyl] N-acetylglucosamine deacetylase
LRLLPAPVSTGIVFRRTDLENFRIEASGRNVARVSYATSLMKKGVFISTTEHLLSALTGAGVDNVVVELDSLEVPILDGSAQPFARLIAQAGTRKQRARRSYAKVLKPLEIAEGAKRIAVYPAETFRVTYRIAFSSPLIGEQEFEFSAARHSYESEIAPARTFGFLDEVEALRKSGLVRGGSLENAVVLGRDRILNPEGLRFPDEFVRHKILDLIGDLALLGHPLVGHVVVERGGHALHYALVDRLLRTKAKGSWAKVSARQLAAPTPAAPSPALAPSPIG